eukprot:7699086-Pyramimonas_sp.AAC.2
MAPPESSLPQARVSQAGEHDRSVRLCSAITCKNRNTHKTLNTVRDPVSYPPSKGKLPQLQICWPPKPGHKMKR